MKKTTILVTLILLFTHFNLFAEQIQSTWTGDGDGYSWGDPANWNPATVPDNQGLTTFAVIIDVNDADIALTQHITIDYLEVHGDAVEIGNHNNHISLTFIDQNGLTNHGELHIGGDGRTDIIGQVTNTENARLEFWWVEIEGNLHNSVDAELYFGSHVEIEGEVFENDGSLLIHPTCSEVSIDANFVNVGEVSSYGSPVYAGNFENNGIVRGYGLIYSEGLFINKGTIFNEPGDTFHMEVEAADPNNNGIIEVNSSGAMTFNRNLSNDPNGVIRLLDGTLSAPTVTQKEGAVLQGFGTIRGDVSIDPNGLIELTGSTNIIGDVEIKANATLEISDGITLVTGYTSCNDGTIHMKGGRLIPQGGFTNNNCTIIWETGLYNNMADFNLDGKVNFKDFAEFADTWLWLSQL
jgi:hypothetical protein